MPVLRLRLAAGGLALATALAYLNSLQVPFLFDDVPAILHNPAVLRGGEQGVAAATDGGVTTSGRPLVALTLALNHALTGEAVWSYHVFNIAIHITAGLLLFGLLRQTLLLPAATGPSTAAADSPALAATALWLLHPLQTSAVTYIVQRAESLMGLCFIATLYGLARSARSARPRVWLAFSAAACLAGMTAKEVMAMAPLLALLYDRTFLAGSWRAALRQRPAYYGALAATWVPLAWLVLGTGARGGTAGFATAVTPWEYLLTQAGAIVHYLRLVLWPHPLVFDYGTAVAGGLGEVWLPALFVLVLLGATLVAVRKWPVPGFAGAWFFLILAPSSSLVPVASQTMAEHRMYLPLAAPLVLLVAGLHRVLGRHALAAGLALAAAAGLATVARNADYADAHRLWADTLAKRPRNARAHHNLALAELAAGRLAEAERRLRDTLALAPAAPEPHFNLGLVLFRQGRLPEAIAAYGQALAIEPGFVAAHNNLANALAAAGRSAEAGRHHAEAVRLQPEFAGARSSYANWLLDAGRPAEALAQSIEAIRLQPGLAEAHYNAGNACALLGRGTEALGHFREAVRLRPDFPEARNNLANALLEHDLPAEAIGHYEAAVQLDPDYLDARRNLGLLLWHLGRRAEARPHLEAVARVRPDDAAVAEALAAARGGR